MLEELLSANMGSLVRSGGEGLSDVIMRDVSIGSFLEGLCIQALMLWNMGSKPSVDGEFRDQGDNVK
jgi:hypothetical protein